ncbi:inheritance of peroxisomes protein 1-domain-containing protein [Xylaria intraflava]|nr:inheritance of peroxisomes protein 1-domain-containing protein [Xylaria intraflava]
MDFPGVASHGPNISRPRRVVTAPVPPSTSSQPSKSEPSASSPHIVVSRSGDLVETLYNHPFVRIISFTSSRHDFTTFLRSPSDNDAPPGSLSPSSRLERTIAAGAFRIYRAPGSVAFLSCGSALQPILPKSQCWCINEDNSRFVLQIRRPQYWRIEVPVADPDDAQRAVLLRDVLNKVLLFEKTECPFVRSFTVHLPEPPKTPVKKKAWTAEGKNLISSPFEADLSPPAHTPKVISRGNRATSVVSQEIPLPSTEAIAHQEEKHNSTLGAEDESSGDVILNAEEHEDSKITDSIASVPLPAPLGTTNNNPVGVLELAAAASLALPETATQDSAAGSKPAQPTFGTEVVHDSGAETSESSSDGKAEVHEGAHSLSMEACLPASQDAQPPIESHEPRGLDCSTQSENTSLDASQIENGMEVVDNCAQKLETAQNSLPIFDDATANSLGAVVAEIHEESSSLNQEDDNIPDPDYPTDNNPASFEGAGHGAPVDLTRKRMTRMLAGRSFTAPSQPTLFTTPPSETNNQYVAEDTSPTQLRRTPSEGPSPSASTDSFHSVQSFHLPTAPPLSSTPSCPGGFPSTENASSAESVALPELRPEHITRENEAYATPGSTVTTDGFGSTDSAARYSPMMLGERSKVPDRMANGQRASRLSTFEGKVPSRRRSHANLSISRRAGSPLPPAANLFSPPPRQISQGRLAVVRRLPAAFVHKTVEILLSPPGHLVSLMLKVAARIAAGEWRGLVFGFGEAGEQIPVQWDYYSDGDFSDLSDSDDYVIADHSSGRKESVPRTDMRHKTKRTNDDDDDGHELD